MVILLPINLVGRSKDSNGDKFEIDEKRHMVKKCLSGHQPITSAFKKGSYRAHFDKKHCSHCTLHKDCSVIKQKKSYPFEVSETKLHSSQFIAKMGTSKYQKLARKRAGIEGIPSVLRRRYKIDRLSARGLICVKGLLRV